MIDFRIVRALQEQLRGINSWQVVVLVLSLCYILSSLIHRLEPKKHVPNAPVFGYWSILEPTLLLQARFAATGHRVIQAGYNKFKNIPFVVKRFDCDITVLPTRYLVEVASMPEKKCSGRHVHISNLTPKWTGIEFMMESDLHFRVVGSKLTTELWKFMDAARTELEEGWRLMAPDCDDWTAVDVQDLSRMLVSRITARVFLGYPACRNMEWLKLTYGYSIDLFVTAYLLRMFPPWLHPVVAPLLPSRRRIKSHIKTAIKLIKPLIEQHDEAVRKRSLGQEIEEEDNLLHWMLDNATKKERMVPEMTARICMLALASIHTTSMSVANMLFSLCEHPEYFQLLTDEIDDVLGEHGEFREGIDSKAWFAKFEKLDSYFVECLRVDPVVLLSPQRRAVMPLTLRDGTQIPAGTRVAFANYQHQQDPSVVADPDTFDPLRCYRKRHSSPELRGKFQAVQLDPDILTFGYGSQACPGRYFAVAEIKMIMVRLLNDYEFKFSQGQQRPKLIHADENVFNYPGAKIMMRKRRR